MKEIMVGKGPLGSCMIIWENDDIKIIPNEIGCRSVNWTYSA
jgi:hypothetical protein